MRTPRLLRAITAVVASATLLAVAPSASAVEPTPSPDATAQQQTMEDSQTITVHPDASASLSPSESAPTSPDQQVSTDATNDAATVPPDDASQPTESGQEETPEPSDASTPGSEDQDANTGSTPQRAAASPQVAAPDVTFHDNLDEDVAAITNLKLDRRTTGTAPWDANNDRGNDKDADNAIVRSFDSIVYDYSFAITPDDQMAYYRNARIGVRVELPYGSNIATFDTGAMSWADTTKGYEASVTQEDNKQVLTAYRLLSPTLTAEFVAPGTASLPIYVKVMGANNGQAIQPTISMWVAYDSANPTATGTHDVARHTPDPVTVSAKLNLNIRTTSRFFALSPEQVIDFGKDGAQDQPNYNLGKITGMFSRIGYDVELRWADRTKGMRGLELPDGSPITFSIDVSNAWKKNSNGQVQAKDANLQPYLWSNTQNWIKDWNSPVAPAGRESGEYGVGETTSIGDLAYSAHWANPDKGTPHGDQTYNLDDGNHTRTTWENGDTIVTETRKSDRTTFTVTVKNYQINTGRFPKRPAWGGADYDTIYVNAAGDLEVGSISTGQILFASPTYDSAHKRVTDKYGSETTLIQDVTVSPTINATSATGQKVTGQSVSSDNTLQKTQLLVLPGGFIQLLHFGCPTSISIVDQGSDCMGGDGDTSNHGTDAAKPTDTVSLYAAHYNSFFRSALPMHLVNFDADYIEIPDDAKVDDYSTAYGLNTGWGSGTGVYAIPPTNTTVKYGVKKDGTNWKDLEEQSTTYLGKHALNFYDSPAEAKSHGKIVAVLYMQKDVAQKGAENYNYHFIFGSIKAKVKADAPVGTVTAITGYAYAWDINQLSGKYGAPDAGASYEQWSQWALKQDPLTLFDKLTPAHHYGTDGRYTKAVYNAQGYAGGDSGGRFYGDSLYIVGESPKVAVDIDQQDVNGAEKHVYDIDREERTADWNVHFHIEQPATSSPTSSPHTTATITVTLPAKLTYMDNSSHLDSTYHANAGNHVMPIGGTTLTPKVTKHADGTTTLVYTVNDIADPDSHTIRFATSIGDTLDTGNDVANHENLTVKATIQSTRNKANPNPGYGTLATHTISVSRTKASQLATRANPLVTEVDEPITFTNMVSNSSADTRAVNAVIIMPQNGKLGTNYHGAYRVTGIHLQNPADTVPFSQITVYVTDNAKYANVNLPGEITAAETGTWKKAELASDGTVNLSGLDPARITAFALDIPQFANNRHVYVDYTIQPSGNHPGDTYVNRLTDHDNPVIAMGSVANRIVNGTVFTDTNRNGARDPDEPLMGNVLVSLVDPDTRQTIILLDGTPAATRTDENGRYEITAIPAGRYKVTFTPAISNGWADYEMTEQQAQGVADDVNSDAMGNYNFSNVLIGGTIDLEAFPALNFMTSANYVDDNEDAGLVLVTPNHSMPLSGRLPWLYVLLAAGVLSMIVACVVMLKKH